jgi:hypothetical protein
MNGELQHSRELTAPSAGTAPSPHTEPRAILRPSTPLGFEAVACPECGSTEVKRAWPLLRMVVGAAVLSPLMLLGSQGKMIFMILVTIWIPCCLVNLSWRCRKCGKGWKPAGLTAQTPLAQQAPGTPDERK